MIPLPSCKTCRWALWERTPTGLISSKRSGRCTVEIKLPPLPVSVDREHLKVIAAHRFGIWTGNVNTGTDCPAWERIQ